jgi:hypothetical protein
MLRVLGVLRVARRLARGHSAHAFADRPITQFEVEAVQRAWGQAFNALQDEGGCQAMVEKYFAHDDAGTIFKPTTAAVTTTRDAAVAYFVKALPAIKGLTESVTCENEAFMNDASGQAFAHGKWTVSRLAGPCTVLDYTMGFTRTPAAGEVKLFLFHSVLPRVVGTR